MSTETLNKSYGYSKSPRDNSQFLFLPKSKSQNSRISEGWKAKQPTESVSVTTRVLPLIEQKIYFELTKEISLAIPARLESLVVELEHSKYILKLKKGWDGETAEPYNPEVLKAVHDADLILFGNKRILLIR